MADERDTITYRDLSKITGLPEATLRALVRRRAVPHLRFGPRTVRFRVAEIEAWLASRVVAGG